MSAPLPTPEEMLGALRESGYLMEQEVAQTLEQLGFEATTNWAWTDPATNDSRETDVRAIWWFLVPGREDCVIALELLCECKNNGYPLVCIGRPPLDPEAAQWNFPLGQSVSVLGPDGAGGVVSGLPLQLAAMLHPRHHSSEQRLEVRQFCAMTSAQKGKWKATHEHLYSGLIYPLMKALATTQREARVRGLPPAAIRVLCPLIVLKAPLFIVDAIAATPPEPAEWVTYLREFQTPGLNGTFAVDFVTQAALTSFVSAKLVPFAEFIGTAVAEEPGIIGLSPVQCGGEALDATN
jgi:hypothetical protein